MTLRIDGIIFVREHLCLLFCTISFARSFGLDRSMYVRKLRVERKAPDWHILDTNPIYLQHFIPPRFILGIYRGRLKSKIIPFTQRTFRHSIQLVSVEFACKTTRRSRVFSRKSDGQTILYSYLYLGARIIRRCQIFGKNSTNNGEDPRRLYYYITRTPAQYCRYCFEYIYDKTKYFLFFFLTFNFIRLRRNNACDLNTRV